VKINIDRKRSLPIEKDCFKKSQNTAALGDWTADLKVHLEDPVSTKTPQCELHKSTIHGRVATVKLLITKSNAHMRKQWCPITTIKPGHQMTGNANVIW
jgi:hypothetical protein